MNDCINTPEIVKKFFNDKKFNIVFFAPGENQIAQNLIQKDSSLSFWKEKYSNINSNFKDKYNESINLDILISQFEEYKDKIFKKNSKYLIYLLYKFKIMNLFQPINIYIYDHDKVYNYSIFKGINNNKKGKVDISMHSQSLSFIFKNEFGFDTLSVNGCFESNERGFSKTAKSLAIGSLNTLGFKLNFSLMTKPKLIFLFFSKLRKVLQNIDD